MKRRFDGLTAWAVRHPLEIGGVSVTLLIVRLVERFLAVRVTGLAAEMTYYAILSFFPLIAALGASLGFLDRLVGPGSAERVETTLVAALAAVFSTEVTDDIVAPMVRGLLAQERTGFALGGFLLSLFLASRVFRSAIDTLDAAYRVEERRGAIALWTLGFLFAVLAILTATSMLSLVVVGPLLGGGRAIADALGLGAAFEVVWTVARWPMVVVLAIAFLTLLYRTGPNVRNTWRQCYPGAVFGVIALILVAVGFRLYLEVVGTTSPGLEEAEEVVNIAAQGFGALLAALLWLWLSAMAILTGGVLNAELSRLRGEIGDSAYARPAGSG
jgi:membrane protein